MIGKGKRVADLCIASADSSNLVQSNCRNSFENAFIYVSSAINNVSAHTWHYKLGHLSFQKLDMLREQLHLACNRYNNYNSLPCSICPLAK